MTTQVHRLFPQAGLLSALIRLFQRDDRIIDPGQSYDRATLRRLRDLPMHIRKDIGADNL